MISVRHLFKSFNGQVVLDDIRADFERGKTNLIIGKSGSGKTVFVKCIVGLEHADSGQILFNGVNIAEMEYGHRKELRTKIGMMFQGGALFDSLTVEANVRFPLDMFSGMTRGEKLDRVNFCLDRVNLGGENRKFPAEISGGMKKRVAIARAIVQNPDYLFCDEPNSGLDPQTALLIDQLIHEITEEFNITTVINTHDMNSVMEIGENIYFLHEGRSHWNGNKGDILHSDNPELDEFIFASPFLRKAKAAMAGI